MSENRFGKGGKAVEKIKVCLVDDNKELVSMLESYVAAQEDMEVIGTAYNGVNLVRICFPSLNKTRLSGSPVSPLL